MNVFKNTKTEYHYVIATRYIVCVCVCSLVGFIILSFDYWLHACAESLLSWFYIHVYRIPGQTFMVPRIHM